MEDILVFTKDFPWIQWIQWIMIKFKHIMVNRDILDRWMPYLMLC